MSRSFLIKTNCPEQITLQNIIDELVKLQDFSKFINLNEIETGKNFLNINHCHIFVNYHDNYYYIESRALYGKEKDLFVAVASTIASVTHGTVSSGDGAWSDGDKIYSGSDLWREYLTTEREQYLNMKNK